MKRIMIPFLEFIDTKTYYIVLHLLGVALGAGGAFVSDALFLSSVKDQKISHTELRFLMIASKVVWTGIVILIISGIGIVLLDPEHYLSSSKFLTKMSIVGIIILNGIVFHTVHLPRIARHAGAHFPSSDEFMRKKWLMVASGAISISSWTFALILGALSSVPYSYSTLMTVYGLIIIGVCTASILLKNFVIPGSNHGKKK